jgi:hypothetical protein
MTRRSPSRTALLGPPLRVLRRPAAADGITAPLPSSVNSLALITSKIIAMGLGGLFWILAARAASR